MRRRGMHIRYWWESQKEREPQGRPRCRWFDDIKIHLREIGCDDIDWIDLAQDRGSIKCWEVMEWLHNWQIIKKGSAP
jgi:hypothetical protein